MSFFKHKKTAFQIFPSYYTTHELGMWERWPKDLILTTDHLQEVDRVTSSDSYCHSYFRLNGIKIHSILFESESIKAIRWDIVNGWNPKASGAILRAKIIKIK